MKIQRAAVIGAGAMGSGIAQVLSQSGMEVILKDIKQEFVDRGLANIRRMYDSRVKKEVLTQAEADYLFGQVKGAVDYDAFGDCDLVIEAALEEIDVKLDIFKELDRICPAHAILATNTSALSISEIASATRKPERVLGMHFFNPAQHMKLVEVIPGLQTSPQTTERAIELCRQLHKIPVRVEECPGFLVNRLLFPYMNEALYVLQEGSATVEEVDAAVVEFGLPMGPFTLFDMTGIDVCAHVNNFLYSQYGPRFAPATILDELVAGGHLGQKSGSGFYMHEKGAAAKKGEPRRVNPALEPLISKSAKKGEKFDWHRVILPMFNEAIYALQEKVVDKGDVDTAMQWGCGMSKGLLTLAEKQGLAWCLEKLEHYQSIHGERFRPSWLLRKMVRAGIRDFSSSEKKPAAVG